MNTRSVMSGLWQTMANSLTRSILHSDGNFFRISTLKKHIYGLAQGTFDLGLEWNDLLLTNRKYKHRTTRAKLNV